MDFGLCIVCCAALGVWGALRARERPVVATPTTIATAGNPHRDTVEYEPSGRAYRWLGTGYPLVLVGAHGDGVLRARIWVAADVTAATLETPNGALPLPLPLLTATRVMAIYIHNIPWWQQAVVRFVATPTHDPQAVIAFAGLAWHPHPDAAIWLAGLWVIALASIGVTRRDGRMAVVLALVALLVVWSWPTAIPWLAGA